MADFEDDFARGESEAARLRARMEAALKRAEGYEVAAEKDAKYQRRLRDQASREARAAGTARDPEGRATPKERAEFDRRLRGGAYSGQAPGAPRQQQQLSRLTGETERYGRSVDNAALAQKRMGSEQLKLNRGLSDSLLIQGQANNQYQRYGALSTEWIGATRRGATTIGELGRQTTATIGKFGGWLAAGSLLYTALGAVRSIGKGAIDSASGVNQLQRVVNNVDPGAAQAGFRERAEKFNLPIGDVSEAAYEMGKVFHDQNQALEASDAVLYSVKVGELGVAESARYLTAITKGFNLEAKDTPGIFDQINAAQNKFGASIRDVEAGIAKAAGTFHAAGGDYSTLLALITTGQKATGQTGDVIGTAIQRIPGQLRQDANKKFLESLGIDPTQPISDLINEAFRVAQTLSGEKLQQLGSAIAGTQYGPRVLSPLLQQFDLYKEVLKGTSPKAAAGSAQRELNILLDSMSETLKQIITELEVLGSNLAEAGFLDIFGQAVILLNQFLIGVNALLGVFNQLPAPLTKTLAIMLELYAVIKLLRHFNVGEQFAAGSIGAKAFTSPDQFKKLYGEDLFGQQQSLIDERTRATTAVSRAQIGLNAAGTATAVAEREYVAIKNAQGATSALALAQQENLLKAEAAVNAAKERVLAAELQETEILTAQVIVEEKQAALAKARNTAQAEQIANRYGDSVSTTFHRPITGEDAARERGLAIQRDDAGQISGLVPISPAEQERLAAQTEAAAKRQSVLRSSLSRTGNAYKQLARSNVSIRRPVESLRGVANNVAEASLYSAASVDTAARRALPAAGRGISKLASGLSGLARSGYSFLGGPIGLLLAGGYAAYEFGDDLGRALAGGQAQIDRAEAAIKNRPSSAKDLRDRLKPYDEYDPRMLRVAEAQFGTQFTVPGAEEGFTYQRYLEYKRQLQGQNQAIRRGDIASGLKPDQLESEIDGLSEYKQGTKAFAKQFRRVLTELNKADKEADPEAYKAAKKRLEGIGAKAYNTSLAVGDFFAQFAALGNEKLLAQIETYSGVVAGGPTFSSDKDMRALISRATTFGVRNLAGNKKQQAEGIAQLQALPQAIVDSGKEELETSLTLARTQAQTDRAYGRYLGDLRNSRRALVSNFRGERGGLAGKLAETEKQLQKLEADPAAQAFSRQNAKAFGVPDAARGEDPRIDLLRKRAKGIRRTLDDLDKAQRFELRKINAALREIELERVHKRIDLFEVRSQIKEVRIGDDDPVAQARQAVAAAGHVLSLLRGSGANQQEIAEAVLNLEQARASLGDAIESRAQDMLDANAALAEARAEGDPIREAQAQIDRARGELNLAKTEAERKQALAGLLTAQRQLDEAYADIALARIGLQIASTEDPVKQAALRIKQAELELKNSRGKAARIEARTQKREAVKEKRDAVANKRIENIEFDAELEKITREQEIAAFERLLKTMDLGREARRDLRRKIHNLKKEAEGESGDFELAVGNIQLPTIYDIRRAVGGTDQPQRVVYQDNSTNVLNARVDGEDGQKVMSLMGKSFRRHNRQARRSNGTIPRGR